jgi:hypothetical protein
MIEVIVAFLLVVAILAFLLVAHAVAAKVGYRRLVSKRGVTWAEVSDPAARGTLVVDHVYGPSTGLSGTLVWWLENEVALDFVDSTQLATARVLDIPKGDRDKEKLKAMLPHLDVRDDVALVDEQQRLADT